MRTLERTTSVSARTLGAQAGLPAREVSQLASDPPGAIELRYIRFTKKEHTSLPTRVLNGKSRNSYELLRFYYEISRKLELPTSIYGCALC